MRSWIGARGSLEFRSRSRRWISTAHSVAFSALSNSMRKPSPVDLISCPPYGANRGRTILSCSRSRAKAVASSAWADAVKPTTSVNMMAASRRTDAPRPGNHSVRLSPWSADRLGRPGSERRESAGTAVLRMVQGPVVPSRWVQQPLQPQIGPSPAPTIGEARMRRSLSFGHSKLYVSHMPSPIS